MKTKLVALKSFRYRTRRLRAGDEFAASPMEARVMKAIKRAVDAPVRSERAFVETVVAKAVETFPKRTDDAAAVDRLEAIRTEYQEISGQPADRRWGEARIRSEIDALRADDGKDDHAGDLF
jgi:hypothetical protein